MWEPRPVQTRSVPLSRSGESVSLSSVADLMARTVFWIGCTVIATERDELISKSRTKAYCFRSTAMVQNVLT